MDRSLVGYSPWDCKESDTTERLNNKLGIITYPLYCRSGNWVWEVTKHVKHLIFEMWRSHVPSQGCLAPLLHSVHLAALSQKVSACLVSHLLPPMVMGYSEKISGVESQGKLVILSCRKCVTSASLSHFICKMGINVQLLSCVWLFMALWPVAFQASLSSAEEYRGSCWIRNTHKKFFLTVKEWCIKISILINN